MLYLKGGRFPDLQTRWFERFAHRENIGDASLRELIRRAQAGQIDAELGGDLIKLRLARQSEGKSGGYRMIVVFRTAAMAVFVYGFPKNERDNLDRKELKAYKSAAKEILALTDEQLAELIARGDFVEVKG